MKIEIEFGEVMEMVDVTKNTKYRNLKKLYDKYPNSVSFIINELDSLRFGPNNDLSSPIEDMAELADSYDFSKKSQGNNDSISTIMLHIIFKLTDIISDSDLCKVIKHLNTIKYL